MVGAEPDHGHVRLAYLARPPARGSGAVPLVKVLAWWAAAVVIRSGYVPLAFGRRRLWAATADAALLFAVMARYALLARRVDQPAALLAVPEVDLDGVRPQVLSTARDTTGKRGRTGAPRGRVSPEPVAAPPDGTSSRPETPGMGRSKASSSDSVPAGVPGHRRH